MTTRSAAPGVGETVGLLDHRPLVTNRSAGPGVGETVGLLVATARW